MASEHDSSEDKPAAASGKDAKDDRPGRTTKVAGQGATSAKGTVASPSKSSKGEGSTQRGLLERAATNDQQVLD